MPCGLRLGFEGLAGDDESEMGFLRCGSGHGFVMGVQVGVIVDLESCWGEGRSDLEGVSIPYGTKFEAPEQGLPLRAWCLP